MSASSASSSRSIRLSLAFGFDVVEVIAVGFETAEKGSPSKLSRKRDTLVASEVEVFVVLLFSDNSGTGTGVPDNSDALL